MSPEELEQTYEALARQIDAVGPEKSELFLAKLALLLANRIGSADVVAGLVAEASHNLQD